jgi:hypothetical protein
MACSRQADQPECIHELLNFLARCGEDGSWILTGTSTHQEGMYDALPVFRVMEFPLVSKVAFCG